MLIALISILVIGVTCYSSKTPKFLEVSLEIIRTLDHVVSMLNTDNTDAVQHVLDVVNLAVSDGISQRGGVFRRTMSAVGNCAVQRYNVGIVFACAIGLGLSYYAYAVETKREQDDSYTPLCDISEHISCTKVFMTEFGKGFGLFPKDSVFNVPNSLYGLAFYTQIAILSMSNNYTCSVVVIALGIVSNIFSLYLAHILYLYRDICIVCVSTYIVNAVIVFLAINKFRKLNNICKKKKKQF